MKITKGMTVGYLSMIALAMLTVAPVEGQGARYPKCIKKKKACKARCDADVCPGRPDPARCLVNCYAKCDALC